MLAGLKKEINSLDTDNHVLMYDILMSRAYRAHYKDGVVKARGYAAAILFAEGRKHVYANDKIVGSLWGEYAPKGTFTEAELAHAKKITESYGQRTFVSNHNHYAPDFETPLAIGIGGMLRKIETSMEKHRDDAKKVEFLESMYIAMKGFSEMIVGYGEAAEADDETQKKELLKASEICKKIATEPPETFREALQLVWLIHVGFLYQRRSAPALGRLDQLLYPFYKKDVEKGTLTKEEATDLLACTLYKIHERALIPGEPVSHGSDVVNIALAGRTRDGKCAVNTLSYLFLDAVRAAGISGPNLSARMHKDIPEEFWDACISLIGTGIGYPALMNDDVNIPMMMRYGYSEEDSNDYAMVGCIENFPAGKQPPWSDGRYNTPKYLELTLGNGRCMQTGVQMGPETGAPETLDTMEKFMAALKEQMEYGAAEAVALFENENVRFNAERYTQPFLSCFCRDCIDRGLDINMGGAIYPAFHGFGCMGVATMADSLAAIEKVVYTDKTVTLSELCTALQKDFEGYEELRKQLLAVPKYGNNNDFVDKYAQWFVAVHEKLFEPYRTPSGGRFVALTASNVQNIGAGSLVAATPDGRKNGVPLSDAASPMYGMDKEGVTSTLLSVSKPDYTFSFGSVVNQKFSPSTFATKENRDKLKALFKVYFARGGQEIQINSISREILKEAMENPEKYSSLVTRVSGFSAFYTNLSRPIQEDILRRTEQKAL